VATARLRNNRRTRAAGGVPVRIRGLDVYDADDEDKNVPPPHPPAARQAPFVQPQIPVFQDNPPQVPAYSAARPAQPSLPRRTRAPRRAASVEVDDPRATVGEVPPLAAPISGPQMSLPKLELPTFKGEKGAKAQIWLESLGRFQKFYRLTDEQAVELARFSCKGFYAKTWVGLLPDDLTFATFKEHFKAEFAVENLDKSMSELLLKTQRGGGRICHGNDGIF
jgi:hypothetical protein